MFECGFRVNHQHTIVRLLPHLLGSQPRGRDLL
jgi:hypothetical protein